MADHDDFGSFLAGFVIGGIAGAVVALLFAPQSGEETRAMIKDKAIELSEKASEAYEDVSTRAEALARESYNKAQMAYEDAKARLAAITKQEEKIVVPAVPAPKAKKPAVKAG